MIYKQFVQLIQEYPYSFGSAIHLVKIEGERRFVGNIIFEEVEEGMMLPRDSAFQMDRAALQELMDEMYRMGIRPTKEIDSAGALLAQTKHLEDMRHLVFGTTPQGGKHGKSGNDV